MFIQPTQGSSKGAQSWHVLFFRLHSPPLYSILHWSGWIWQIRGHLSPQARPQALGNHLNWCPSVFHPQFYDDQRRLPREFFLKNDPLSLPKAFLTEKEVSQELWLEPGTYLIVPCTSEARQASEFVLRVFSRKHIF